jgi:tripartite-type tricarboxylate transporter receptor subunit TctC
MARFISPFLSERLGGVPVVVDNKPGASTMIGADYVAKARPDGCTLLLGTSSMGLLVLRKQGSSVDMRKDLSPVLAFAESVYGIMAGPAAPFTTLPGLIAYAKANPDKVTYGIPGAGTTPHLVGEYFGSAAGIRMMSVPYKGGGPQTTALLGGETMLAIDSMGATNGLIREGRIRLLGTSGAARTKVFPDVPPVADTLPGFTASGLYGLMSPPGTPKDVIDELNAAMVAIVAKAQVQERFASLSLEPIATTPAQYRKLTVDEVDKWARITRERGVVIE